MYKSKGTKNIQKFLRLTHVTCKRGELKHLVLLGALDRVPPECFDDEESQQCMQEDH